MTLSTVLAAGSSWVHSGGWRGDGAAPCDGCRDPHHVLGRRGGVRFAHANRPARCAVARPCRVGRRRAGESGRPRAVLTQVWRARDGRATPGSHRQGRCRTGPVEVSVVLRVLGELDEDAAARLRVHEVDAVAAGADLRLVVEQTDAALTQGRAHGVDVVDAPSHVVQARTTVVLLEPLGGGGGLADRTDHLDLGHVGGQLGGRGHHDLEDALLGVLLTVDLVPAEGLDVELGGLVCVGARVGDVVNAGEEIFVFHGGIIAQNISRRRRRAVVFGRPRRGGEPSPPVRAGSRFRSAGTAPLPRRSEQGGAEIASRSQQDGIGRVHRLEEFEDPHAQAFPVLTRRGADETDQPAEGLAGVTGDDLGVRRGEGLVDVLRVGVGGRDGVLAAIERAALEHRRGGPGSGRLVVLRVRGEQLVVLGDRRGVVTGRHGLVGLHEPRVGSGVRVRDRGDAARNAVGDGRVEHLPEDGAHLLLIGRALEERRDLTADDRHDGRDGLNLEGLGDARLGVDVDRGQQPAAGVVVGDPGQGRLQLLTSRVGARQERDHHRVVHRLLQHRVQLGLGDLDRVAAGTGRGIRGRLLGGGLGRDLGQVDGTRTAEGRAGGGRAAGRTPRLAGGLIRIHRLTHTPNCSTAPSCPARRHRVSRPTRHGDRTEGRWANM